MNPGDAIKEISCSGKKAYHSRAEAKDPLWAMRRRFPKLAFEIYKCRICGFWHIGHDRKYRNAKTDKNKKRFRRKFKI